jgi:peptidyl-prolyl cis-trans isomerase B (cyclophilin B)
MSIQVTFSIKDYGTIEAELYPEIAPESVKNFVALAKAGYYDGLSFHRIIPGFMIQGGCPQGTGTGGPGYTIKGEFSGNGVPNDLRHTRGVLSMARAQHPNSAGSQFFIMHRDAPHLDGQYAAFGKVTAGLEVVDKICAVGTDRRDHPTTPVIMETVKVTGDEAETLGEPVKIGGR